MTNRQLDEEAIFHVARRIEDPAARADYLQQVCGDNTALLARVEALLEVHEKERDFLGSAPHEPEPTVDSPPISEGPGTEIGRYRLMEQIGEGGMGVVFVAEQREPLRRKVALKVIKPGMDTKAVVARFEAERQALALMDHPNIAKVLDAGTTELGRPYFVMELVRGVPITEYCDQNRLTVRERLGLFVQVCQAIQHAHQKGIIHRDIKPTNVLVTEQDGRAIPKVIDFGVAKALNQMLTERTIYTSFQAIVGTPLYMSPEQARLSAVDVDTRSDVYSLGVLIYELLTGVTPLEKQRLAEAAQEEVLRIIREEEPPKPSTRIGTLGDTATTISQDRKTDPAGLRRSVQGDLDWIVMKSLEKDRLRRYDTASAFAADIERFLENEPIEARPPSSLYRLHKFAGKNRGVVVSVCAVAIALLFGMIQARISQSAAESLNRELEATLATLKTEYLDRAVGDALAGDVRACDESLELAQRVDADSSLVRVIHALALMYGGSLAEAISELEEVEASNPDNMAVLAASLWANLNNGEVQLVTDISQALARLEAAGREPSNDYERLLLAHTKVLGSGLSETVADLDGVIARHPRWGIAYAIRAEARTELAKQTKDMVQLRRASSDAMLAGRYHPDNAFVLSSTMYVYVTSIELARHESKLSAFDIQLLENRATEIASQLESRPGYLLGRAMRLVFYRLMRRDAEYTKEYATLRQQGFGGDQSIVADILLDKDQSKLPAYLEGNPHSFAAQTTIALRGILNGNAGSASSALAHLKREFVDPNQRWLMLDLALIAQNRELARQLAKEFLRPETVEDASSFNWLDGVMTKYYAGEIGESELLEMCGPFLVDHSVAHYAIGMWKLSGAESKADWEAVKQHLRIGADCPIPGWWHVEFAKVYLQLIEDRKIPVRGAAGNESRRTIPPSVNRPIE